MEELSEEQIEEFKEAFSLFDPEGKGYIETKELGTVLRSLGIHATDEEKNEYIEKYDQEQEDNIYFNDFLEIIIKKISESKPEDELLEALNLFDTEKKHEIDIEQFREEFKENLPNVPENEINDIIEFLKHEGGTTINIQEAVQNLSEKIKSHLN
jgi:calmodulin